MKDSNFKVSLASENDCIHASKSDLPKIFKITFSQIYDVNDKDANPNPLSSLEVKNPLNEAGNKSFLSGQYALLMAETREEANKWVIALTELRTLFLGSGLPRKDVYVCRELCDAINIPLV
jgi:hypothetical protein